MIIDVMQCEDCNNCFLSCKDEYVDNEFPGYSTSQPKHGHRWVNIMRKERGQHPLIDVAYLPVPCMHCDNASCLKAGKDGAVYKRPDGIVIIDPVKAVGQKEIVEACPYHAIWWNEEKNLPQKCTLCAHLLDNGWKEPRCVQACPTRSMRVIRVDDNEMQQIVEAEKLEVLHPEYDTQPRVYYRNLYRFNKCFIGGSIALQKDDIMDCAKGADITLLKDSVEIGKELTNSYGDFKFDNLEENSGEYSVVIGLNGFEKKQLKINLENSINIGTVIFST